jgi:hypothetical protein
MPIITKPALIEKGIAAEFSLDKSALALHPIVVADDYFSSPNNWGKVDLKYKSDEGGQFEIVEFDASLASPTGRFFVSETAKDIFEVEKITIIDHDGGILVIPRADLTSAEFDIDFSEEPPLVGAVQWNTNASYVFNNNTGGMTSTNTDMVNGFAISTTSTFLPAQDKSIVYTLDVSSITTGSSFGYYSSDPSNFFSFRKEAGNSATQINIYSQAGFYSNAAIPASGTVELKIQSKGSTSETKWFVNGVEVASRGGAGSGPMYPKCMLYTGSSIASTVIV